MNLYVVRTNYLHQGFYGIYSTLRRAQKAMEHFLAEDDNIVSMIKTDAYEWQFTTVAGEQFGVDIIHDVLDYDFEDGTIKEDE